MRMKQFTRWLSMGCLVCLLACSEDNPWVDSTRQLQMSVSISNEVSTKGLVEKTQFNEEEEIGLFLQGMETVTYEGRSFNNLRFTAVGTGEAQTWTGEPVMLSSTKAKAFRYWPYGSATAENYTAYPISAADQIDYLYSGWITNISNAKPNMVAQMKHALTAIQFNVVRGNYTGVGKLTDITVSSDGLGASGKLNLSDGSFSDVTVGEISLSGLEETLVASPAYNAKILAVPNGVIGKPITGLFTIDDKQYSVTLPFAGAYKAGTKYIFDIKHDGVGLTVQQIRVTQWTDSGVDQEIVPIL